MSIHSRIKERRLALGLTSHKALADLVGVSWQTVQLWEKEEKGTAPNRGRIDKVAEVLGVSTTWLNTGVQAKGEDPAPQARPAPDRLERLDEIEEEILMLYRGASERGRTSIINAARNAPRGSASSTESKPNG